MSDFVEKRREAFLKWVNLPAVSFHFDSSDGLPYTMYDVDPSRVLNRDLQKAWGAWNAALDSAEIDLPTTYGYDGYEDGPFMRADDVVSAIKSAGLNVK